VIGILSDRDVRTALGNPLRSLRTSDAVVRISSTRVADVMTRNPITLPAGTPIARLVALFADHKIGAVPILDSGERLVGIVSYIDLLRAAAGRKAAPN
jgi:CBS domain-containing protein